jgi:hypothetical protein
LRALKNGARWHGLLLGAALIGVATWEMWRRFNRGNSGFPIYADIVNYYIPMTAKVAERLASGELPLWNPENCSGMPLLATLQTGVFYPGTWLALLLPAHEALPALALGECVLGGCFAFALFRAWGCRPASATVGGLVFTFACCMGQTMWPPAIATIAWTPWILLCVEMLARGWSARWWAALAMGCALQVVAGFPQFLVYSYYLVAPYAALRVGERIARGAIDLRQAGASAAALATAVLLGAGLAAVQLGPTAELVGQSVRSHDLGAMQVHYLTGDRLQTSGQVLAGAFDSSPRGIAYGYPGTGYVGVASLSLIALALVARRRQPLPWLLLAIGAAALLLSDGFLGPLPELYALYAEVPFAGTFRTPERHRLLTFLAAGGLAALGLSALERGVADARERRLLAGTLVLATGGTAVLMVGLGDVAETWRCALAFVLLLPLLWVRSPRLRHALAAAVALFIAVDLVLATPGQARMRDIPAWTIDRFYDRYKPASRAELAQYREIVGSRRLEWRGLLPFVGAGPTGGIRRISCYEPLAPGQWARLHERITGRATLGKTLFRVRPKEFPVFYDVTSVRLVVQPKLTRRRIWHNRDALPRAYFLGRVQAASVGEAFDHIVEGDHDFHRVVLIEHEQQLPAAGGGELVEARIVDEHPERVVVEVDAAGPGVLVLTDSHYPGWEARVDGAPAEILLANGVHRAVAVAGGPHEVVFAYRPSSLRWGAAVSIGSLLLLLVVLGSGRWRRRRTLAQMRPLRLLRP